LVGDEEARLAAKEILSAPEFMRWKTDYQAWLRLIDHLAALVPDWVFEAIDWIGDAIDAVFRWLAGFLEMFGVFGEANEIVGWLGVCLLVASLIVLGRSWQRRVEVAVRAPAQRHDAARDHAEAMTGARRLAQSGHYLEAAHRVQLATLALLIELDWLELARSDPNQTLRDRVRASALPGEEGQHLIALVDRLETLWFNEPEEDRGLFEDWISFGTRIEKFATGRTP
jgi:hypothetical protein